MEQNSSKKKTQDRKLIVCEIFSFYLVGEFFVRVYCVDPLTWIDIPRSVQTINRYASYKCANNVLRLTK